METSGCAVHGWGDGSRVKRWVSIRGGIRLEVYFIYSLVRGGELGRKERARNGKW